MLVQEASCHKEFLHARVDSIEATIDIELAFSQGEIQGTLFQPDSSSHDAQGILSNNYFNISGNESSPFTPTFSQCYNIHGPYLFVSTDVSAQARN